MSAITRDAVLQRGERLGWPLIVVNGLSSVEGSAHSFNSHVSRCFPVELAAVDAQLDQVEAGRGQRSTVRSHAAGLVMLTAEEQAAIEAERVTRMEIAEASRQERLREEEIRRLAEKGIA